MNPEPTSNPQPSVSRIQSRIFILVRIGLFSSALTSLFLNQNLAATAFLTGSFLMGAYAAFMMGKEEEEKPLARFWLQLGEKVLVNLIFLTLFLRLLWRPEEPFPTMLCTGLVTLTLRNVFYLIFSIVLLKERRLLPLNPIWSRLTNTCLNLTLLFYVWNSEFGSRIFMVSSILLILSTSIGYLYFYYRDVNSRKPLSVATQVTLSRIVLSPVFIWLFFYDNNLVYQDNHLVFKILAALMAIFFVASDGLDGYLARKRGEVSQLGKFLDPYSDKISNMSIFLCFLASGYASVWMVAIIFFRESTIETLRTLGAAAGVTIDARKSGKWKTALQGTAIITILVLEIADTLLMRQYSSIPYWSAMWAYIPYTLMALVTAITFLSGFDYFAANKKVLERYF
jgi:CDP-diacylglycerol--glycerol-3-phosphate 3-phosphatidyltransferase